MLGGGRVESTCRHVQPRTDRWTVALKQRQLCTRAAIQDASQALPPPGGSSFPTQAPTPAHHTRTTLASKTGSVSGPATRTGGHHSVPVPCSGLLPLLRNQPVLCIHASSSTLLCLHPSPAFAPDHPSDPQLHRLCQHPSAARCAPSAQAITTGWRLRPAGSWGPARRIDSRAGGRRDGDRERSDRQRPGHAGEPGEHVCTLPPELISTSLSVFVTRPTRAKTGAPLLVIRDTAWGWIACSGCKVTHTQSQGRGCRHRQPAATPEAFRTAV